MARSIPASGIIVTLFGAVLAYSAIKGKSISNSARALLAGQSPGQAPTTNPITTGAISDTAGIPSNPLAQSFGPKGSETFGARSAVVAYAQAQLGKPYLFAAAGPNSYDCSGLTMKAWAAGGMKSLVHYSVTQRMQTKNIPMSQAQAGDIIFVSYSQALAGAPHHCAIYIGAGQIIEAYDAGYPIRVANVSEYNNQYVSVGQFPG